MQGYFTTREKFRSKGISNYAERAVVLTSTGEVCVFLSREMISVRCLFAAGSVVATQLLAFQNCTYACENVCARM